MTFEGLIDHSMGPRFKILHRIGHGSFGEVFKERNLIDWQIVELKRISVKQRQNKDRLNEIEVLSKIENENVVDYCTRTSRQVMPSGSATSSGGS